MRVVGRADYKESEIVRMPAEWLALALGDCALVTMGQSPAGDTYNNDGIGVPLLNGPTEFTDKHPVKIQWTNAPTKMCQSGDILICVRGSSTGRINISNDEYCIGRGLASIRCKEGFLQDFLIQLLHFSVAEILKSSAGSTFPSVDRKAISSIRVPTPPVPEQQKIAAILTAVDDKLDVIARQIAATKTLKQGLMQTLFSRGVGTQDATGLWVPHVLLKKCKTANYPDSWKMVSFENVAPIVRRPVEIEPDAFYPELGLRSFGKGTFHKPALSGTEVGNKRLFKIQPGDLLLSNVFAWEGSVAVARKEDEGRFGSHRYITCKVDNELANTSFVFRYITTPDGIELLKLASPGGAGRNRTLGLSALAAISIPLPPLVEQDKITEILDGVDAKLSALINKQTYYQTLKRGLMQKLLTGEWRVKLDDVALVA